MARKKSNTRTNKARTTKSVDVRHNPKVSENTPTESSSNVFINRVQGDLENKNAILNLILGALIILVGAVLIFNYLNKPKTEVGPTQETAMPSPSAGDVAKESLPGNYTVKSGDTLFTIAQHYYDDGYKYPEIMKANEITDENNIAVDQIITIPSLTTASTTPDLNSETSPSTEPSATVAPTESPTTSPTAQPETQITPDQNTNIPTQTTWGEKIDGDTYTVQAGDWLSTISARAYGGDIYSYQKIAQANNLSNPDLIEPGMVLKIPR